MAALANVMYFMPTAIDTYVQAQGTGTTPLNAGLAQFLANLTRTGATINTVAGFAYQGAAVDVANLARYMADTFSQR